MAHSKIEVFGMTYKGEPYGLPYYADITSFMRIGWLPDAEQKPEAVPRASAQPVEENCDAVYMGVRRGRVRQVASATGAIKMAATPKPALLSADGPSALCGR